MTKDNKYISELIYQLADDNFIHSYRGSEWLGLAPHIEEDVAFSSINQDTMGHASMYFELLETLGEGSVDELSHNRKPKDFRNAIILEEANGSGTYLDQPEYDWAFTVIRHLFFGVLKEIRLESLNQSSYEPLIHTSRKIQTEQYYHLMHWKTWFTQLMLSTQEARDKMEQAISRVWRDFGGVISLGKYGKEISDLKLIASEDELRSEWLRRIHQIFDQVGFSIEGNPGMEQGNGRNGEHTEDLTSALNILSEVYHSDIDAVTW
ncbi:1,2-phenylacetyl-CoA epoxidase subunit PaaC [Oceanobacillus sp. J11TS1]|uniref:1,2-phenylacetyl-CoA epoxidase subunit PaaC n=1 Tax=Oceanobacillus sp. J11TS1 TaxID=2807191 RepID=UPI001B04FA74|nr:1,2-phenylacetyl-CoA epoxidase subunit PaaC [Oceanobacillus sp. J11TS1]GIO23631.1 phenylacetate-CoA oxygenase subunit PaaI [Oceanobacillus sp. J11TS1]